MHSKYSVVSAVIAGNSRWTSSVSGSHPRDAALQVWNTAFPRLPSLPRFAIAHDEQPILCWTTAVNEESETCSVTSIGRARKERRTAARAWSTSAIDVGAERQMLVLIYGFIGAFGLWDAYFSAECVFSKESKEADQCELFIPLPYRCFHKTSALE